MVRYRKGAREEAWTKKWDLRLVQLLSLTLVLVKQSIFYLYKDGILGKCHGGHNGNIPWCRFLPALFSPSWEDRIFLAVVMSLIYRWQQNLLMIHEQLVKSWAFPWLLKTILWMCQGVHFPVQEVERRWRCILSLAHKDRGEYLRNSMFGFLWTHAVFGEALQLQYYFLGEWIKTKKGVDVSKWNRAGIRMPTLSRRALTWSTHGAASWLH